MWALVFFGLNPLVLIDILVSGHNDIVMMGLALASFFLLKKRKNVMSIILLSLSILVKFASIALFPMFIYCLWMNRMHKPIKWIRVWKWSAYLMLGVFLLSPIREEIYSWYFIWPLIFVALLPSTSFETAVSLGFTFGLVHRISPYILTREWGGNTPTIKNIVTFSFPALTSLYYAIKSKH